MIFVNTCNCILPCFFLFMLSWFPFSCLVLSFMSFLFSQERTVKNFSQVDAELGRRLTEGLRKHSKSSTIASANL